MVTRMIVVDNGMQLADDTKQTTRNRFVGEVG